MTVAPKSFLNVLATNSHTVRESVFNFSQMRNANSSFGLAADCEWSVVNIRLTEMDNSRSWQRLDCWSASVKTITPLAAESRTHVCARKISPWCHLTCTHHIEYSPMRARKSTIRSDEFSFWCCSWPHCMDTLQMCSTSKIHETARATGRTYVQFSRSNTVPRLAIYSATDTHFHTHALVPHLRLFSRTRSTHIYIYDRCSLLSHTMLIAHRREHGKSNANTKSLSRTDGFHFRCLINVQFKYSPRLDASRSRQPDSQLSFGIFRRRQLCQMKSNQAWTWNIECSTR